MPVGKRCDMRTVGKKARIEEKEKSHASRIKYTACVVGMLFLVAAAFWMPQAVFAAQNYYQGSHLTMEAVGGDREISGLALGYKYDVRTRMEEFARGVASGRQYYAVVSDYELSEDEQEEILNSLPGDVYMMYTYGLTMNLISLGYSDLAVEDCKRYVIFDQNFESGIAFSCLYLELSSDLYSSVQILMDLEDDTIYYVKAASKRGGTEMFGMSKREVKLYIDLFDSVTFTYEVSEHYGQYYHADSFFVERDDGVWVTRVGMEDWPEYLRQVGENSFAYAAPIIYGDDVLSLDVIMQMEESGFTAAVGLREIGELIPEFSEK